MTIFDVSDTNDTIPYPEIDPEARFQADCTTLRRLKESRAVLKNILDQWDDAIEHWQKSCNRQSLRLSIKSLPDDILAIIFEHAHDFLNDRNAPLAISHVNRRFRHVALSTPRLWSHLHDSATAAELQEYLFRSKSVDLSIYIPRVADDESNPLGGRKSLGGMPIVTRQQFLDIVAPQSHRWRAFSYCDEASEPDVEFTNHALALALHLPRLKSMLLAVAEYIQGPPAERLFYDS
jgi:hypothetical protein